MTTLQTSSRGIYYMKRPLVSAIVPAYNAERYLAAALESIFAQEYRPIEIIVVDDGSADGTADIVRFFKEVRYIYQTNQGQAMAMNVGIAAARGELIAFLDADDLWAPNKLSVQIDYLLEHPQIGYVIARMQNFLEPGTQLPQRARKDHSLADYAALSVGTLVARKTIFEQVGDFDSSYPHAKDVDWFVRAKQVGIRMAILSEVLLYRRLHESNLSYQTEAVTSEFLQVVKSLIDRRRNQEYAGK